MSKIGIIGASGVNGAHAGAAAVAFNEIQRQAQAQVVELLEQVLSDARDGKINSIALVACGSGGFSPAVTGPQAPELNLGLDACKRMILDRVLAPRPSPLLVPGRGKRG